MNGRPIRTPNSRPTLEGTKLYPGMHGGTNWYSPFWSPHTGLFYVAAWKDYYSYFSKLPSVYNEGQNYFGGAAKSPVQPIRRAHINSWTDVAGHGEIIALDPHTGKEAWAFKMHDVTDSGILTTATDVLFTGSLRRIFLGTGRPQQRPQRGAPVACHHRRPDLFDRHNVDGGRHAVCSHLGKSRGIRLWSALRMPPVSGSGRLRAPHRFRPKPLCYNEANS